MRKRTKEIELANRRKNIAILVAILIASCVGVLYAIFSFDGLVLAISIIGIVISLAGLYYFRTHPVKMGGLE